MTGPFRSLEDSKHAYYLVFDFEMAVADKFGSTWGRGEYVRERNLKAHQALDLVTLPAGDTFAPRAGSAVANAGAFTRPTCALQVNTSS